MLKPRRAFQWLTGLGVPEGEALRAVRLARRASIVRLNSRYAVVAVPSQRLGLLPRERVVSHADLEALLRGSGFRVTEARVGRLPEEQQVYLVRVTREGASCSCPATVLAGDPLCIHRLAAAVKLYEAGRLDLLGWLPGAVEAKKRWLEERRRRGRPRGQGAPLTGFARGSPG